MLIDDPAALAAAKKLQSLQARLRKAPLKQVRQQAHDNMLAAQSGCMTSIVWSWSCAPAVLKHSFPGNTRVAVHRAELPGEPGSHALRETCRHGAPAMQPYTSLADVHGAGRLCFSHLSGVYDLRAS